MRALFLISAFVFFLNTNLYAIDYEKIIVGAERIDSYLPLLENKRVAIIANHTSFVGKTHLVDTLISLGVNVIKIFAPEHGFRGVEDAGGIIKNDIDNRTGLPLISLYGKNKKPSVDQLKDIDIVIFDIQDVGVRFYTYISTMYLAMEACSENEKTFLVLDRPNPNGFYVDGPILENKFKSFIGMFPIPIVHGLTVAELAIMINGENWLNGKKCKLEYVLCENYNHNIFYELPIKPSPNLPNMASVFYYPTLGLLEGTVLSVGRGTEKPFQYVGHPEYKNGSVNFTPVSGPGSKSPKWQSQKCFGFDVNEIGVEKIVQSEKIDLQLILDAYNNAPKENFFKTSFNKLAGNSELQKQITGMSNEILIRNSWQEGLRQYKLTRKKYLLYEDFE